MVRRHGADDGRPELHGDVRAHARGGPAITQEPQDRTVRVGGQATFSVTATGTGRLRYQWQREGVDIPGATQPRYTTPPATLDESGATFQVVVSDRTGSTTSRAATLAVWLRREEARGTPAAPSLALLLPASRAGGGTSGVVPGPAACSSRGAQGSYFGLCSSSSLRVTFCSRAPHEAPWAATGKNPPTEATDRPTARRCVCSSGRPPGPLAAGTIWYRICSVQHAQATQRAGRFSFSP